MSKDYLAVEVLKVYKAKIPLESSDLEFLTKAVGSMPKTMEFLGALMTWELLEPKEVGIQTIANYRLTEKGNDFLRSLSIVRVLEISRTSQS
jgi:predicted transcriptional regulator